MARTYTITVTDDETGAVIFAGRPTAQVRMILATDTAGRLACDCGATVADDLAGMDAEAEDVDGDDITTEDRDYRMDPVPQCRYCNFYVWPVDGGWAARGTIRPSVCPTAPALGHMP